MKLPASNANSTKPQLKMKHISLFNGIGGFQLAAQWMGWENIASCEIDPFCNKVTKHHFPNCIQHGDINEFDGNKYRGGCDIISGGFPCQDISYAKSWTTNDAFRENGIEGKRSGLWFQYHRIIDEIRPKFVVAENVSALTKQGLNIVIRSLSEIGYDAEWCDLSAFEFGAPHKRERIWIVAYPFSIGRQQESIIFGKIFEQKIRYSPEWESSRAICQDNGKKTLSPSFGIHDGLPRGLDDAHRIRALGNAIVPHPAYQIFKAIQSTIDN